MTDFSQWLLEHEILQPLQVAYAQQKQRLTQQTMAEVLLELGLLPSRQLGLALAKFRAIEYAESKDIPVQASVSRFFSREGCLAHSALPCSIDGQHVVTLVGSGDAEKIQGWVQRRTGLQARLIQTDPLALNEAIQLAFVAKVKSHSSFATTYQALVADTQGQLPVQSLLDQMLSWAVDQRASDVHLMPDQNALNVLFRIDGVLIPMASLDRSLIRLVAAIKVKSGMDISNNLRPQDGRFSTQLNHQNYDIRSSTSVTPQGEAAVLRLLAKDVSAKSLVELGFDPDHQDIIGSLFEQPYGIVLLTGPTGSGKTTTLHAGLRPQGMTGKSILTVEEPIEYRLPVAIQTQVNRKSGHTFDSAIRHFLRHDPDIMLIGEIRDTETAQAAVRAAETGHLVLSTLHANSVSGIVNRLNTLQISPSMLADTLVGSLNQRLVRKLCEQCKVEQADYFEKGAGCEACQQRGYVGRLPVYELLTVTPQVAEWIDRGASRAELLSVLDGPHYVSAKATAERLLQQGLTSPSEVLRVLGRAYKL